MKTEILDIPEEAKKLQERISERLAGFKVCFSLSRFWYDAGDGWIYDFHLLHEPTGKRIFSNRILISSTPKANVSPEEVGEEIFNETKEDMIVRAVGYAISELPHFKEEVEALRKGGKDSDG